jgi:UDPglucose--hexose-1-phosphate uridylyltransferase
MSSMIKFTSFPSESVFLDPRKGFEQTLEQFEVRIDPLTGRTGHVSHLGAIAPQKLPLELYKTPEIKGFCPFCTPYREKKTPKFISKVLPDGRSVRNEAFLIPNLFPYDIYNAVVVMTDEHVAPLEHFNEQRLYDALFIGIEFLKRIRSIDPRLPYHIMAWNYMPPSGGGLVHPHQQFFATEHPGNQFIDELKASEQFWNKHGHNYWSELVKEEKKTGERFIGHAGDSCWLTSFVSLGILGDITCIFPDVFSIDDFMDSHIHDLVTGMLRVFRYYRAHNIFSFNSSLFFGPADQDYFSCHFRIIPRTFLNVRDYASDFNFFQSLLSEPVSVVSPEKLCEEVRTFF